MAYEFDDAGPLDLLNFQAFNHFIPKEGIKRKKLIEEMAKVGQHPVALVEKRLEYYISEGALTEEEGVIKVNSEIGRPFGGIVPAMKKLMEEKNKKTGFKGPGKNVNWFLEEDD